MYAISVVVATYNPNFDKLKLTLISLIKQKEINYEIILTDDGSKNNYFEEVSKFFKQRNFVNYTFVTSSINTGTIGNVCRGIEKANGEFIKLISPGDCLYDTDTLSRWYKFIKERGSILSFSNAIYYELKDNNMKLYRVVNNPANLFIYKNKIDVKTVKYDYLLNNDLVLGAATIVKKDIFKKYLNLLNGKVKYAEDHVYRLMIADGIIWSYFDNFSLWSEYGTGISTQGSEKWITLLKKDWHETDKILVDRLKDSKSKFDRKYVKFLKLYENKYVLLYLFPSAIILKLLKKIKPHYTCDNININYFKWFDKDDFAD